MRNMVTIQEAVKIIKERAPWFDMVQEYATAYEFYVFREEDEPADIGGGNTPIIILKNGGKMMRWADYFMVDSSKKVKIGQPRKISEIEGV